jgi:hypothetical protein
MLQLDGIKLTASQGRAKLIPPGNLTEKKKGKKKKRDPYSESNKNVGIKINGIELGKITCNARGVIKTPPPPFILRISETVFKIYLNYCVDLPLSCTSYSCGWICTF